ncbi:MAG TPA: nuclear transport factor 2 family protein [Terriglobales bacterium]|nr:nuclear transport factor 2 family protein [Terriglobales bacterium]
MKKRIILIFIFFLSLLSVSCVKKREIKIESEQAVLENTIKEFVLAVESADRDKVLSFYAKTPDITVVGTGEEYFSGYSNVENFYKDFISNISQWKKRNFALSELQVKFVDGIAWFSSRLTLSYEPAEKPKGKSKIKSLEKKARFTGVLIKEEGNWKFVQEHMSFSSPKAR